MAPSRLGLACLDFFAAQERLDTGANRLRPSIYKAEGSTLFGAPAERIRNPSRQTMNAGDSLNLSDNQAILRQDSDDPSPGSATDWQIGVDEPLMLNDEEYRYSDELPEVKSEGFEFTVEEGNLRIVGECRDTR